MNYIGYMGPVSYTQLDVYKRQEPRLEDVIDEMIAILSDREEIIKKKEMEQSQMCIRDSYQIDSLFKNTLPHIY